MSKIWGNIYFVRFRSGLRYCFLNSIVNRIPSWTIRKLFYKLSGMKLGKGCRIGLYTIIDYPKGISIDERSVINENCFLDGRGGIKIGKDVSISIYTKIISASHMIHKSDFKYYEKPVYIENNVWTGTAAIILDGSQIKEGAVVGAGCVIKGTADQFSVYVGNPAQKIKIRQLDGLYKLDYHPWMR